MSIAKLRTDFAQELAAGRARAKASKADDVEITKAEYFALLVITDAFASPFHNSVAGNLLWLDANGKGAHSVEDAFAGWMARGAYFNTSGIAKKMEDDKVREFSRIVTEYRNKHTEEEV